MKKIIILFLLCVLVGVISLLGCNQNKKHTIDAQGRDNEISFGIYLVTDKTVPTWKLNGISLDKLQLASDPIISEKDIIEYNKNTHVIKLVPGVLQRFPDKPNELPFVIIANGKRCYFGAFFSLLFSKGRHFPVIFIHPEPPQDLPVNCIRIERYALNWKALGPSKDPRTDSRIMECLDKLGKLKK